MDITVRVTVTDRAGNRASRDVTVVEQTRMPVGSSNIDNATELNTYESRFGPLKVRRSYNQPSDDLPASWAASAAAMDANKRASVYSFKPTVPSFAAGAYDARVKTFLGSIPTDGFPKWLILWHEPESEIKDGLFTPAQFKSATARFDNLVRGTGRGDLLAMVCFAGTQCFDGQTAKLGWDADDLVPPGVAVCFDAYNRYPEPGFQWREASERFALQLAWARARGARWAISETGCHEYRTNPLSEPTPVYDTSRKVTWSKNAVAWASSEGAEFFCYWDNSFGGEDPLARRLHSSAQHIACWRDLTQA